MNREVQKLRVATLLYTNLCSMRLFFVSIAMIVIEFVNGYINLFDFKMFEHWFTCLLFWAFVFILNLCDSFSKRCHKSRFFTFWSKK